jgi:hypothetical protein
VGDQATVVNASAESYSVQALPSVEACVKRLPARTKREPDQARAPKVIPGRAARCTVPLMP